MQLIGSKFVTAADQLLAFNCSYKLSNVTWINGYKLTFKKGHT